jgi:hypothetical protein
MIVALLVAGIGFVLAGLLGILFGLPVKEFSFGNTLILAGAVTTCTGMILLGLWTVVRELRAIAQRLESGEAVLPRAGPPAEVSPALREPENDVFPFGRDQPSRAGPADAEPATLPPWHQETATRDRARNDSPPQPGLPAEPAAKPRRSNLLFSSTSRKERERAELRVSDPSLVDPPSSPAAGSSPSKSSERPAASEDTWPHREAGRAIDAPLPRRSGRMPSTFTEANAGATGADRSPPPARNEDPSTVSVLKSGVVDGMAYSLYSDGSIEAQMPEGLMRFASIDELRAHLDQRS